MRYAHLIAFDLEWPLRTTADFLSRRSNGAQDDFGAAVGISATLHRYFAGQAALPEALDQLAVAQMRESPKTARWQTSSAAEALRRKVTAFEQVSGYLKLLNTQNQDFDSHQPAEAWAEIEAEIKELFPRGQREGEFRPDRTAFGLTEAFYSLDASAAWVIQGERAGRREFTDMITDLLLHEVSLS